MLNTNNIELFNRFSEKIYR